MISVILPTISGREGSLSRTVAAYGETLKDVEHELIVVKDEPTWPAACNMGYAKSKGDILHFTADDLEPLPGWHVGALEWLESHDELPAAKVLNFSAEGEFDNAEDGADGAITWFTRVPIMRRDQYERIGSWPEIIYLADIWFSEKARALGIETRMIYSYAFVHHWSKIGRVDSQQNLDKSWQELNLLRGMYATQGGTMPSASLGDQRYKQTGVNSAGDPVYERRHDAVGYANQTKDELSAELEKRGLAKSGSKAELVARLEEDDGS